MPNVILVDKNDTPIGESEKLAAHQQGLLHRAFSVFILRKNDDKIETLLQQREKNKYHAGGLWTNSCCSHPEPHEPVLKAGERRLQEELGFSVPLQEIGVFTYRAAYSNGLIEHEIDHVLIGYFERNGVINPDKNEVADYKWLTLEDAGLSYQNNPTSFTPWFAQALGIVESWISTHSPP